MKYYNMIDGEPVFPKKWYYIRRNDLVAKKSGLMYPRNGWKFREVLEKGTVLYEIISPFGDILDELKTPTKGICVGAKTHPTTFSGDNCCWFGKIEKIEVP
jgi:hypothetical protein